MLILIEGIDRVGKSTLAEKLHQAIDGSILLDRGFDDNIAKSIKMGHSQSTTNARELELINVYESMMEANHNTVLIVDRFHLSTALYESVLRNNYTNAMIASKQIDRYFAGRKDIVLIHVKPSDIELSSKLHGSDLSNDARFMQTLVDNSFIKNKLEVDWFMIENCIDSIVTSIMKTKIYDVYLAGPFFNEHQIEVLAGIEDLMDSFHMSYFSPRWCGMVDDKSTDIEKQAIFHKDIKSIQNSRYVFAITDGKDMGTLFECGYAFANNVPIVYIALDLKGPFNLMLAKSALRVVRSMDELKKMLCESVKENECSIVIEHKDYEGEIE